MKYFLILTALSCISLVSSSQIKLSGNIQAIGNSSLIIKYFEGDKPMSTTINISNGKFLWEAPVKETQKITMIFPGRAIFFFVDPGEMTITGTRDSIDALHITGSKTNDEAIAYSKTLTHLLNEEKYLSSQYGKLKGNEKVELEEKYAAVTAKKNAIVQQYISNHPESAFSLNLVSEQARLGTYESVQKIYDLLSRKNKATSEGKRIAERLEILKRSAIGEKMRDFTLSDNNGKLTSMANFKGKVVLIDFWASWCYPCREEIPNLIKNYSHFKDKNFTIVSISLDEHNEAWLKAVSAHQMPWTQLIDEKAWDGDLVKYYGIKGIPSTLLIDPNGKIIAKDLRSVTLSKKLTELFGQVN